MTRPGLRQQFLGEMRQRVEDMTMQPLKAHVKNGRRGCPWTPRGTARDTPASLIPR